MGFADSLKRACDNALKQTGEAATETVTSLFTLAKDFSPVQPDAPYAKGLFINSWYPAVNNVDPTVGAVADMSGSGTQSRIDALKSQSLFYGRDEYVTLANNLDYAMRVELLGWDRTGPYSPARLAVLTIRSANLK
jgi:hypothetical protein